MSVKTWPGMKVSSFRWKKANMSVVFSSIFGSQSLTGGAPLWQVDLAGVPTYWPEAIAATAFFEALDGYTNQLALYNLVQPVPAGTMRGVMTLSGAHAQGATSLVITAGAGQAATTLLTSDLVGLGSGLTQQVVRVASDATADGSGVITVAIGTPLRNAFASGAAVTWNKPAALFRQRSITDGIEFVAVIGQPWSLSLLEDPRP